MQKVRHYLRSDKFFQNTITVILIIFFIIQIYPMIYVISASVSDPKAVANGELVLLPIGFTLQGYEYVLEYKELWLGYMNTLLYTVGGTLVSLAFTLPAAYTLSRKNLAGSGFFMALFMITMYISGGLIPSYLNIKALGLLNTRTVMVVLGAVSVYNLIIARTFFSNSIPEELLESAKMDGCSDFGTFFRIVLPLSKACIAVQTLYYGVAKWNSYFEAMIYLKDRDKYPLQMFLREILVQSKIAAASASEMMTPEELQLIQEMTQNAELVKYCVIIVSTLPMMIIYPKLQKFFEKGVMIGSVKG